jgi:hypothetical protein
MQSEHSLEDKTYAYVQNPTAGSPHHHCPRSSLLFFPLINSSFPSKGLIYFIGILRSYTAHDILIALLKLSF